MIGSLYKSYDFPIIVSADDLKELSKMLSSNFEELEYTISTKDGARYTLNSLDEVLSYSNPDNRKIQRLCVRGRRRNSVNFIHPSISISLLDKSVYTKSCELEITQLDETEICYYSQRMNEFTKRITAPYRWLHKPVFNWIVGILFYILSAILCSLYIDNAKIVSVILLRHGIPIICMIFSVIVTEKIIFRLFPECCFVIGEQKKQKDKIDKRKKLVFVTIILALVIGVLGSIIAYYIVQGLT